MTVETVVERIVALPGERDHVQEFTYNYGGKSVHIYIDLEQRTAWAYVASTSLSPRAPGATTEVFRVAYNDLYELAGRIGSITFGFRTENAKLRKWALDGSKGKGIFNWQRIEDINLEDIAVRFEAWTTIG